MALIIAALSRKSLAAGLIASLAVGVGIDYAIHFIDALKREYRAVNGEGRGFPRRTFTGAEKAILISAVSVGVGFSVLALSQFRVIAQFGGLIALSIAVSAVVSLTVIPVPLTTVKPKFIYKSINNE
jgi:predicted RND superfamily exporter protein